MSFQDLLTSYDNNGVLDSEDMIALGLVQGTYQQLLFSRGTSGASGTFARIGDIASPTEMTTASKLKISSSSTDDVMTSGTGAWKVRVYALDANWNQTYVDVELNGQTAVETTLTYLHPYLIRVLSAGTGVANAGTIYVGSGTVTSGVPDTKYIGIIAGKNISRSSFFPVPLGYNLIVNSIGFSYAVVSSSVLMSFEGCVKPYSGVWEARIATNIDTGSVHIPVLAASYAEKTLIKLQSASSGTAAAVNGYVNFKLIKSA